MHEISDLKSWEETGLQMRFFKGGKRLDVISLITSCSSNKLECILVLLKEKLNLCRVVEDQQVVNVLRNECRLLVCVDVLRWMLQLLSFSPSGLWRKTKRKAKSFKRQSAAAPQLN